MRIILNEDVALKVNSRKYVKNQVLEVECETETYEGIFYIIESEDVIEFIPKESAEVIFETEKVRCIKSESSGLKCSRLTTGKEYEVVYKEGLYVWVIDDLGRKNMYRCDRFESSILGGIKC